MLNVRKFYRSKTLLITGASGFVGKVLLWSVLTHLDLKRVYVILRDKKDKHGAVKLPASDRLHQEVWKSPIFINLPDNKKNIVTAIAGDIETDGLGLSAEDHTTIIHEVDVIIHAAASVRFQATLKDNLNTNTFGSLRVLELAKACQQLQALVHVSTAYVNSDLGTGLVVEEKAFPPLSSSEEMLNILTRVTSLDNPPPGTEEILKKLQGSHFNTYTFTKQLAEDLVLERRGDVPVGIVRPTIVGSAWKQPRPGWVDSALAAGALFAAGATGVITICPGRPHLIGDQIPVDFVCNCAIVMGAAIALNMAPEVYSVRRKTVQGRSAWPVDQPCKAESQNVLITQVSSSTTNPVSWKYTIDIVQAYFQANPVTKANCRVPRFSFVESTLLFRLIFSMGTLIPAMIYLYIVHVAYLVSSRYTDAYKRAQRNVKMAHLGLNIAFAFAPFTSLEWYFDNRNTLALHKLLSGEEQEIFYLDSRLIEWREWLVGYCQGIRTEVLKEPPPAEPSYSGRGPQTIEALHLIEDSKPAEIVTKSLKEIQSTQKVIILACRHSPTTSSPSKYDNLEPSPSLYSDTWTLNPAATSDPADTVTSDIITAEDTAASSKKESIEEFLKWTQAKFNPFIVVPTAIIIHSTLDLVFKSILIDRQSAEILTQLWRSLPSPPIPVPQSIEELNVHRNRHPILLIPTHKSYFDFVVLSFVCLSLQLRLPMVAADKVFSTLPLISTLIRASGAFFLQRGGQNTPQQTAILATYFKEALQFHSWVQFFIEGGRSRTGYVLRPKKGLLRYAMDLLDENKIDTIEIVPIGVNYGEVREMNSLSDELLGHGKVGEGISRVIYGLWDLLSERALRSRSNYESNNISIKVGDPITVTLNELGDTVSWNVIFALQKLRQLSPKDIISWSLLNKENLTTFQISNKIKEIIEYLKLIIDDHQGGRGGGHGHGGHGGSGGHLHGGPDDTRQLKVFGLIPDELEKQIEYHLIHLSPFKELFEQTSHIILDITSEETSTCLDQLSLDQASLDTLPSQEQYDEVKKVSSEDHLTSSEKKVISETKLTQKVWAPRWGLPVPKFNLYLNQIQFHRAGALDLLCIDAFLSSVILTKRRSNKITPNYIISEAKQLANYLQETAIARRLLTSETQQLFVVARRLLSSDISTVALIRGLLRPLVHGVKLVLESLRARRESKEGDRNPLMSGLILEARQLAATTPCAIGCYPLVDQEVLRSVLCMVQEQRDLTSRRVSLESISASDLYEGLVFVKPYVDE